MFRKYFLNLSSSLADDDDEDYFEENSTASKQSKKRGKKTRGRGRLGKARAQSIGTRVSKRLKNVDLCAECGNGGGPLIQCTNLCRRQFHRKCIGLEETTEETL